VHEMHGPTRRPRSFACLLHERVAAIVDRTGAGPTPWRPPGHAQAAAFGCGDRERLVGNHVFPMSERRENDGLCR